MADEIDHIVETPGTYPETITLIKESDPVKGGAEGIANKQGTELANRTGYLYVALMQIMKIVSHYMPQGISADLNFPGAFLGLTIQELNLQVNAESVSGTTVNVSLSSLSGVLEDVDVRVMGNFGDDNTGFAKVLNGQTVTNEKLFLFDAVEISKLPFIKVVITYQTKWWEFVVNVSHTNGDKTYCTLEPKSMPTIT